LSKINVLGRPFDTVDDYNEEIESENKIEIIDEYRPPKIIGNDKRTLKFLTAEEAIMKMELSGDPFMIFRGEEDRKLKVIYRRNDGNYGIILPE
jgi:putative sigma-54 modulation protein